MLPIVGGVLAIVWYFVNVVQRFVEELKGEWRKKDGEKVGPFVMTDQIYFAN